MKEKSSILFKRYLWLVNTIKNAGHISMNDIDVKWSKSTLNEGKECSIPKKTFYRHKEEVEELFGIQIKYRKTDKTYFIEDDLDTDKVKKWILNSFAVFNLLQEGYETKDLILFESIPSGTELLIPILNAIKTRHNIKIEYQKFVDNQPSSYEISPLCLKVDKLRWYVLAVKIGESIKKTYALDRIKSLSETDNSFIYPSDFQAEEYFHNSFGIFTNQDREIEHVIIKANKKQSCYLRTLPLHHSQMEEFKEDGSIFHYKIKLDREFEMELLKMGSDIEIIQPKTLKNSIIKNAIETLKLYNAIGEEYIHKE